MQRKAKSPQRFRTEENEAVGQQRIGSALDRIVTTGGMISAQQGDPHIRDRARIGRVAAAVNSSDNNGSDPVPR